MRNAVGNVRGMKIFEAGCGPGILAEYLIHEGAKVLAEWGVKEVVVTLGSMGSVIYADSIFYTIPAYKPAEVVDATGCGDTYMAGYLYKRIKGTDIQQAGEFAAAMAGLKIETSGPFVGTEEDVKGMLEK